MFFHSHQENQNVIHIYQDLLRSDQILEDMVHHGLESHRTICQTKKHNKGFKKTTIHTECSFPFIPLLDSDIIVSPSNIKLREYFCILQSMHNIIDQR